MASPLPADQARAPAVLLIGSEDIHLRLNFMRLLRAAGWRVIAAGSLPQPDIEAEGFEYHRFAFQRRLNPVADLRALLALRRIIIASGADLVHAFDTKFSYLAPMAMFGLGQVRGIVTITGMGALFSEDGLTNSLLRLVYLALQKIAARRVDFTIFQNMVDQGYFLTHRLTHPGKSALIRGSGVIVPERSGREAEIREEVRRELGLADAFTFIMIARMVRQKGIADLLAAARRMAESHPAARFVLIGPAAQDEPGGVPTADFDAPNIIYLGRRWDVARFLLASDVFVLPTRYREGVPRAMLEALAIGKPVIVSDMPGCADPVRDADAGWVFGAGKAAELHTALGQACATAPEELRVMGARGREIVIRDYALDRVSEQIMAVYRRLLAEKSAP